MVNVFISENQIVCFPSFVLTVFWCTTSYTVIFVLWKVLMEPVNALAHRWPCASLKSVSGLRRLEKTLNFLRCICHWPGAQRWFRHKWRRLVTASLLLHCIGGYSCLRYWNEFFSAVFHVLHWTFLVLHFSRKRLQLESKSDLTTNGLIFGFLSDYASFRRLHICMDWNLHELLICYFFWRHQIFSMFRLRGILVCSLKMLVLFSHKIL